jgi:hypothetical protein
MLLAIGNPLFRSAVGTLLTRDLQSTFFRAGVASILACTLPVVLVTSVPNPVPFAGAQRASATSGAAAVEADFTTALVGVNLVFLAFLRLQFRLLHGGRDCVAATAGLTLTDVCG